MDGSGSNHFGLRNPDAEKQIPRISSHVFIFALKLEICVFDLKYPLRSGNYDTTVVGVSHEGERTQCFKMLGRK